MELIAGLGNPGKEYKKTRHNIGFMVLDELREELKIEDVSEWSLSDKFNAKIAGCHIGGEKLILAKPMTYMNKSGQAVELIGEYYSLTPENLTVVHDDIDLQFGDIKVQENRSSAGHNGIKSIINRLGTKEFTRMRVGIATDKLEQTDPSDFVLSKFGWFERSKLKQVLSESTDKLQDIINRKL